MTLPNVLQHDSSSVPSSLQSSKPFDEVDIDKFATLFSPSTPRASPTFPNLEMKATPVYHSQMDTSGSDSEFGSFVSVSATEDPLGSSDFDRPASVRPSIWPSKDEGSRDAYSSLSFFDKFGQDAKIAAERNRQVVLDELLLHEDDPLYWLKGQGSKDFRSEDEPQDAIPFSQEPLSILDDPDFPPQPSTPPQPKILHPQTPSRSPTIPAPATLAPPLADTSSASPSLSTSGDPLSAVDANVATGRPGSSRSPSYQTLSTLSSRWMSSLLPTSKTAPSSSHTSSPSLESLFAFEVAPAPSNTKTSSHDTDRHTQRPSTSHATTSPAQISHGTPFGRPAKASPFASHTYIPPTGAPGFKGEQYDWDKGFSAELERELGVGEDLRKEREIIGIDSERVGVGQLIEKMSGGIDLNGRKTSTTPVLRVDLANKIRSHLPALARLPKKWVLLYSLDQHGISLNTLYSRCEAHMQPKAGLPKSAGALVVVKDAGEGVFGVWMGEEGVHPSRGKGYYGSGDSFMWKYVTGQLEVFKWTGKNSYIALSEPDYLSFGGGDGHYGLYLDESLFEGSSARCPTFENEPLCSSRPKVGGTAKFECVGLEVWGVGP